MLPKNGNGEYVAYETCTLVARLPSAGNRLYSTMSTEEWVLSYNTN